MHPTGLEHIMFCPKILVVEPSFKIVDNFLDNFFLSSEGIIAQIPEFVKHFRQIFYGNSSCFYMVPPADYSGDSVPTPLQAFEKA